MTRENRGSRRRTGYVLAVSRRNRWAYMADPRFNPPNEDCPTCEAPSRTYFVGGRTVDGVAIYRWRCEHRHEWEVREAREGSEPT